jgi:hypothetical protein
VIHALCQGRSVRWEEADWLDQSGQHLSAIWLRKAGLCRLLAYLPNLDQATLYSDARLDSVNLCLRHYRLAIGITEGHSAHHLHIQLPLL